MRYTPVELRHVKIGKVLFRPPQLGRHHVFQHNVKPRTGTSQRKTASSYSSPDNCDGANLKRRLKLSRLVHFLLATAEITDS